MTNQKTIQRLQQLMHMIELDKQQGWGEMPLELRQLWVKYLGYSKSDLDYLGEDDIFNFQGVANPHSVAKIQRGEVVLDIGSGLGIDAFLAARDCGADVKNDDDDKNNNASFVVGVYIAQLEVGTGDW